MRFLFSLNAFFRNDFYYLLANNSFRLTTRLGTSFNFILTRKPTCFEKINAYVRPLRLARTDSISLNFRVADSSKQFTFFNFAVKLGLSSPYKTRRALQKLLGIYLYGKFCNRKALKLNLRDNQHAR